jgi:hypothetical protein
MEVLEFGLHRPPCHTLLEIQAVDLPAEFAQFGFFGF